jgi:hypothetical protein
MAERVAIWPDGTWVFFEDIEDTEGDDYMVVDLPEDIEDIDAWAYRQAQGEGHGG